MFKMLNKTSSKKTFPVSSKLRGFTLIELLVVIAIIGLLSTLAVIALDSARQKSRDSKRVTDIRQIQTALELYFNDQEGYPYSNAGILTIGAGTDCAGAACSCLDTTGFAATCTGVVYMGQLPADPIPAPNDAIEYEYVALSGGSGCGASPCETYEITFELEGQVNELSAGLHTASPEGIE